MISFKRAIRPKKKYGQHFLDDEVVLEAIAKQLERRGSDEVVVEIGPGTGNLTEALLAQTEAVLHLVEVDGRLVDLLRKRYDLRRVKVIEADFLAYPLEAITGGPMTLIGNLPYNISSQILFKLLAHKNQVKRATFMLQKEVAQRITAPIATRAVGILTVLLQAFYRVEYLFSVPPTAFSPPPKVDSAVVYLERNEREKLPCSETLFYEVVKKAFQQRRKKLRNGLRSLKQPLATLPHNLLQKRPAELSIEDFIAITQQLENNSPTPSLNKNTP